MVDTMWMVQRTACLAVVVGIVSLPIQRTHAQALAASLDPGTELRIIEASGGHRSATFLAVTDSALQVRLDCGAGCAQASAVRWTDLRAVDAHLSQGHSVERAALGGVVGAAGAWATATLIGAVFRGNKCEWDTGSCPALGFAAAMPLVVLGGGAVGASIGWRHERFRWQRVWPES